MTGRMHRRDFLKSIPSAALLFAGPPKGKFLSFFDTQSPARMLLEPFDYQGVTLLESRWLGQYKTARDAYYSVSNDDILKGFRDEAGLPAPGHTLGGWCEKNSNMVFGQWLSGMARMYRATGDRDMREKAVYLMKEFAATVKPDGNCRMVHYPFDKLVCGLVDMKMYAECPDAIPLLDRVTDWAIKNLSRENRAATPHKLYQGIPSEWYTLSENLYRAYQLTGNQKYRDFAKVWLYPSFWDKFAETSAPADASGIHAYSHVNTFSSAAMAYAVTGDPKFLRILRNAYDYIQNTQCYATGGFGPREEFSVPDETLMRSLGLRYDCFETGCGSWAGFKMSRYLMEFTGESRYGDWIERLFYNGIGAALPFQRNGKNYYYADYRLAGGMKAYNWEAFTCCSGTYIQDVVDYHNLIYYKDRSGVYVNLFVPSEVIWNHPEGAVRLTQNTRYPEEETSTLTMSMRTKTEFTLRFRVPVWARGVSAKINDAAADVRSEPGTWAVMNRVWSPGDRVEITIPLRLRMQPIDRVHKDVVAIVRGPVAMVLESDFHEPEFRLPDNDEDLNTWFVPDSTPGVFRVELPGGGRVRSKVRPFYDMVESYEYKMYFDRKALPSRL